MSRDDIRRMSAAFEEQRSAAQRKLIHAAMAMLRVDRRAGCGGELAKRATVTANAGHFSILASVQKNRTARLSPRTPRLVTLSAET